MGGGDGSALLLDTSNAGPAYLAYNFVESDGTNNIALAVGTVSFWFNPSWTSTNHGGTGPGAGPGRFFEVGNYTTNASVGWLSLYVSSDGCTVYFAGQTNNGSQGTYLSAPVTFVASNWYNLVLTYGPTNSALYLNGLLVTNGTGVAYYPSPPVAANGFSIGSSVSNIVSEARGIFDDFLTYNYQLDAGDVSGYFDMYGVIFYRGEFADFIVSAPSSPSTNIIGGGFNAITGTGYLMPVGTNTTTCTYGTNLYQVWFTNTVPTIIISNSTPVTNFTFAGMIVTTNAGVVNTNLTFAVAGGSNGVPYDVFANSALGAGSNFTWAWLGQAYTCVTYSINMTNLTDVGACFLILGTPQDSDGDGLTDAYELLVSHTNPYLADTDGDGIPDGWEILLGLNPLVNDNAQTNSRSNYSYTLADWLDGLTGVRSGSVTLDSEGNVLSVSQ